MKDHPFWEGYMKETVEKLMKVTDTIDNCIGLYIPIKLAKDMFRLSTEIEDYCKQMQKGNET